MKKILAKASKSKKKKNISILDNNIGNKSDQCEDLFQGERIDSKEDNASSPYIILEVVYENLPKILQTTFE